jgi:hypothetical protein
MKRLEDWPARLDAYLESRRNTPFIWGKNDCASFAAGAIEAMTGEIIGQKFLGSYHDKLGALEVIQAILGKIGWGNYLANHASIKVVLTDAMSALPEHFGFSMRPTKTAQRGDLVLLPSEDPSAPALGIVSLDGRLCAAPGKAGMQFKPLSAALKAWKV